MKPPFAQFPFRFEFQMGIFPMMEEKIPIFPLGLVLLPGMQVPLHIFEERYREMVDHCLEEQSQFGIVYYNGSNFRSTGCSAGIVKLVKRYEDGRKDILIEGERRFSLESIDDTGMYLHARVRYFDDCATAPVQARGRTAQGRGHRTVLPSSGAEQ
jgi:Lon protease-like protein